MENNIEEKGRIWYKDHLTNVPAEIFRGGYTTCTSDIVKVIEEEIATVVENRKQPGLPVNEYVKGSYAEIILTDLLTKLKTQSK